jgi:hypothetical protein
MEPGGLLLCLQVASIGSCPETDEASPHLNTVFNPLYFPNSRPPDFNDPTLPTDSMVMPWLRQLVAGLSPQRLGFAPGSVHVEDYWDFVSFPVSVSFHRGCPCSYIICGWTAGTLVAAVQRHSLTPSSWSTRDAQVPMSCHVPLFRLCQKLLWSPRPRPFLNRIVVYVSGSQTLSVRGWLDVSKKVSVHPLQPINMP